MMEKFIKDVQKELNELSKIGIWVPKVKDVEIAELYDPSFSISDAADTLILLKA